MKTKRWMLFLVLCLLLSVTVILTVTASASEKEDAMAEIEASNVLSPYKQGDTQTVSSDGYIGIPVKVAVYYDDATFGAAKPGYNGTAVILYVVNSGAERVGTDSDETIIQSMIERGYAVAVCDYQNNAKAVSPALEYSAQKLRAQLKSGTFFQNKTVFPSGTYYENHVVPAGHNITLNHVFYEIDKHGTDGELERIVHAWNEDFRGCKRNVVIRWTDDAGNRKTTQNGFDGSAPVWYSDAAGTTVDSENGIYTQIQYTKAMTITDCVKKDGSPIDLNLYMFVVYPTSPENDVPVMILSGSAEHLATGAAAEDRPYLVGYSMQGYAVASYDFEYIPMARDDHYGYFAGDQANGISGVNGSFALGAYNRANFQTAAVRYLRYLSINDHETYAFNNDKFGVYGNSKGGFQTFLGAAALRESATLADLGANADQADLEAYVDQKVSHFYNEAFITATDPATGSTLKFDGDSRYQNGHTADIVSGSFTVEGGTLQPWLTYTDENGVLREIPSGVQWVYSSCGGTTAQDWENHSPVFTAANYYDSFGSGYSTHNYLANLVRIYDVPSLFFEAPLAHNLVSGKDVNYGVDTYLALFKASNYYLKDTSVDVVYTVPNDASGRVSTTDDIVIRFYGPVTAEEIAKVVIKDGNGKIAVGTWESSYGGTEWAFRPAALNGGAAYTVTVPASLKGNNGKEMGEAYTFSFYTEAERTDTQEKEVTVTSAKGAYVSFEVPVLQAGENAVQLRFKVSNNAANVAKIYAAASESDTSGALLGSITLKGAGYYEYDVTDYVMGKTAGTTVGFLISAEKAASDEVVYTNDFSAASGYTAYRTSNAIVTSVAGESVTALKMANTSYGGWYPHVLTVAGAINNGTVTKADYGRQFTVTLRVYDTASRPMQIWFTDCTNGSKTTGDYDYTRAAAHTVAGQWTEISVPYVVYEADYGYDSISKQVRVIAWSTGSTEMPYYIDSLTVTEHITDIALTEEALVISSVGEGAYQTPASDTMAWEVNGQQTATWWEAINKTSDTTDASASAANIKLLKNYVFDSSVHTSDNGAIAKRSTLTVDLGGHTLFLKNSALFTVASDNNGTVTYYVKNGTVVLDGKSIVNHARANTAGDGKQYHFLFTDVNFEIADSCNLLEVFASSATPDNAAVKQNFTFTDCTFDIDRSNLPKAPVTLFPAGTTNVTNSYTFAGGRLAVSSYIKLSLSDCTDAVRFVCNADSEYTAFETNAWTTGLDGQSYSGEAYAMSLAYESTEKNIATYQLTPPKYPTPYGVIPEEYDPENYPFAVFIDGTFIGAYATFYNTTDSNKDNVLNVLWQTANLRGENTKKAYIVLRRDLDMSENTLNTGFNNLCQLGGSVTLDLGGYRLKASSADFMRLDGKYGYDTKAKGDHVYPLTLNILNGTLDVRNSIFINYSSMYLTDAAKQAKYDKTKVIDVNVTSVDFIIGNKHFIQTSDTANREHGANVTVNFTDCGFDLTANTSAINLFDGRDTSGMNVLNVNITGGNFTANSFDTVKFSDLDEKDAIRFLKTGDAYTTTVTVPTAYTLPAIGGKGVGEDTVSFGGTGKVSGTNSTYSLIAEESEPVDYETEYGTIPAAYTPEDYPFAVFIDGTFIGAYSVFYNKDDGNKDNVLNAILQTKCMRGETTSKAVVLMRRDYDCSSNALNTGFNNLCQLGGTVTFDLGGYRLTTSKELLPFYAKYGYDNMSKKNHVYPLTINFMNGTIDTRSAVFMVFNSVYPTDAAKQPLYDKAKDLDLTFTNIDFIIGNKQFIKTEDTANLDHGADLTIDFIDCDFDLTANTSAITLFDGNDANKLNKLTVNITGGNISAKTFEKITFADFDDEDSGITFKKTEGKYETTLTVPTSYALPQIGGTDENGEAIFFGENGTVSGSNTIYSLAEKAAYDAFQTEYGTIPAEYDVATYPFAIFLDGEFIGAYGVFYNTTDSNKDNVMNALIQKMRSENTKTAVVVLRRDCDLTSNTLNNGFRNTCQLGGTVVFDLGGYKLTTAATDFMELTCKYGWDGTAKKNHVYPLTMNFKNGTIDARNGVFINYSSMYCDTEAKKANYNKTEEVTVTFTDIDFILGNKHFVKTTDTANLEHGADLTLDFIDCNFDLTANTSAITLFDGNDAKKMNDLTVNITGGNIAVTTFAKITFSDLDADDCVNFLKTDGNYTTTVTVPTAYKLPVIGGTDIDGEKVVFGGKGTVSGDKTVYSLAKLPRITGFKQNVAFQTNFKTNVYIPKLSDKVVTGVSYNGTPLTLGEREIEGADYWVATVEVDAEEANEKIALVITFTYGGNTYTQTISTNIVNYANALAKYAEYADLANAMLYYAKCAAPEAGITATRVEANKVAAVNTMKADTPITGVSVAITSAPVFTFTLNGTFEGSVRFTWKSGEATSTVTKEVLAGDTSLALNELLVYDFTETISVAYSADGENFTEAGSYNLSAYAESAAGQTNADLVNALYDYAEQAKAYTYAE